MSCQVVEVEHCLLQKPQADALAAALRQYLAQYHVPGYDETTGRGLVLQAGALLALAALWGGEAIWFAPVISEAVCLVMALAFMVRFWKSNRTLAAA